RMDEASCGAHRPGGMRRRRAQSDAVQVERADEHPRSSLRSSQMLETLRIDACGFETVSTKAMRDCGRRRKIGWRVPPNGGHANGMLLGVGYSYFYFTDPLLRWNVANPATITLKVDRPVLRSATRNAVRRVLPNGVREPLA